MVKPVVLAFQVVSPAPVTDGPLTWPRLAEATG